MTFSSRRFWQVIGLFAVLDLCLLISGCSTAWTTEATSIVSLLVPAIQAALAILAGFGVGLSPAVLTSVNSWATQAETDLATVKALIEQYNTASATAQPGILTEIKTALGVVSSNLAALLPSIKVTDPATQAKITAVLQAVAGEISALIALVPALQGKVTSAEELKALVQKSGFKSAKDFKKDFNSKAGTFGKQYEI